MRRMVGAVLCLSTLALAACGERQAGLQAYRSGDYDTALEKIVPAAENGKADAQYYLGIMYLNGYSVEPSMIEAYKWFDISRVTANDFYADLASIEVVKLQDLMSPRDLAAAQDLAREWLANHPDR